MVGILDATALLAMALLGSRLDFSFWYYLGLLAAVLLWAWQLWQSRHRERDACFKSFLHNHWVGAVIFAGIFLHYSLT